MKSINYTKGLHDLGDGVLAYLMPDGSWCLNNAGLVVDGDESLLIDTLTDVDLTREMLDEMAAASPAATSIDALVITHGNLDHFYGSELVKGAEIIATNACAEEMKDSPPESITQFLEMAGNLGAAGEFATKMFGRFNFKGLNPLPATRTFEGRLDLNVGNKTVQLIEVGPAHTQGDAIVYLPKEKIIFAGDMLFIGGTPIMWVGPMSNWLKACDLMLDLDVDAFVPGHGPVTDKKGVASVKGYLEHIYTETRKRFEDGMTEDEAAKSIDLGPYNALGDRERIVVNVNTLYREFSGNETPPDVLGLFTRMAEMQSDKNG